MRLTEVNGISIPPSSALTPRIAIQLQVPTKTIRTVSDVINDRYTSENTSSLENYFFSHFSRAQRKTPMRNSFTDFINQIQNNQTVTNRPIRSIDQTFMPKTTNTTVPTLSIPPSAPLKVTDTY